MNPVFQTVGIMGKPRNAESADTIRALHSLLVQAGCRALLQDNIGDELGFDTRDRMPAWDLVDACDLVIVVGGDGSMLNAGRMLADKGVPVLGINRGSLGFLTDIPPSQMEDKVLEVLSGRYVRGERFLLDAQVSRHGDRVGSSKALNDIVLFPGEIARMIEFDVYVDGQFVYNMRSDGLIVATPTGSTAYSLSGGGPILHPRLNALVLVPMFPHILSNRPIVIDGDAKVEVVVSAHNQSYPQVSCDGQVQIPVSPGDTLSVRKADKALQLLHPEDYDYYHILRTKLGWSAKR
jgi:NAD+ kinase